MKSLKNYIIIILIAWAFVAMFWLMQYHSEFDAVNTRLNKQSDRICEIEQRFIRIKVKAIEERDVSGN